MNNDQFDKIHRAALNMDWGQVVANGGPPCFHLDDDGSFCGRAERWDGHGRKEFHEYRPLSTLLREVRTK